MTVPVPEQAVDAACDALDKRYREEYNLGGFDREHSEGDVRAVLEAAAPFIAAQLRAELDGVRVRHAQADAFARAEAAAAERDQWRRSLDAIATEWEHFGQMGGRYAASVLRHLLRVARSRGTYQRGPVMRGPVETKVAAGGGTGALLSLIFGLAAQYHWFTPPSPYLTALTVTVLSFAAAWLAPHTPHAPPEVTTGNQNPALPVVKPSPSGSAP